MTSVRDDRCASDHGRELWFPFLDEEIVIFLQDTSIDEVTHCTPDYLTALSISLSTSDLRSFITLWSGR